MKNENREMFREIAKDLPTEVKEKGYKKHGSFTFSFSNIFITERDDMIRADKENNVAGLSVKHKLSRKQIYTVLKRK